MVFSSPVFFFFFLPLCFIFYFNPLVKNVKYKNSILFIFSILFYLYSSPKYFYVLITSILMNYIVGILLKKDKTKKIVLFIGIVLNISILSLFKIKGFYSDSDSILPFVGPLGISFYTFQEISYIIDVYRKTVKPQKNIFRYSLYVTFFPQLIAGPIVRYEEVEKKLNNRKTSNSDFSDGVKLFIIGLFKKCVIADSLILYVEKILKTYSMASHYNTSILLAWFSAIILCMQLYYDFSAYSDMAIGMLKIFGFNNIGKNFDNPYRAYSINNFWKRWNISLCKWFNDYVLYPLCNCKLYKKLLLVFTKIFNRKMAFSICNFLVLLLVWLLVGLWHGVGINYLYLGIYYFLFLYIEKLFRIPKNKGILSHIYTLIVIIIGTVIFFSYRDHEFLFLKSLFINKSFIDSKFILIVTNYWKELFISVLFILPIDKFAKKIFKNSSIYDICGNVSLIIMFLIAIYFMVLHSNVPFVYFNF